MQTPNTPNPWQDQYKIPWNDPDFSRRILTEHLTQQHDLASRRTQFIDQQVQWIHQNLLQSKPSIILDLTAGPGLYSHRLASLKHHILAIDFSPASIQYAKQNNPHPNLCTFKLDDIRTANYAGPYNLAMLLYGEFNVFSPSEIKSILSKIHNSLAPNGQLIIEPQTFIAVQQTAQADTTQYDSPPGLFSDNPHNVNIQNQWLTEHQASVQTFTVTETETKQSQTYKSTAKAWTNEEIYSLLSNAGFKNITQHQTWPTNTDGLTLYSAKS